MIRVARPGYSAVQDLGRHGFARFGVPRGGAFDEWALRAGNALCGNDASAAGIEFVLSGPTVVFEHETVAALTGARFAATIDAAPAGHGTPLRVPAGATLSIGSAIDGARGYLCVAGGVRAPVVLGSRSVSARAGIGSMLSSGDRLPLGAAGAGRASRTIPLFEPEVALRVVAGPHDLASGALETLLAAPYTVTPAADRVGIRLDGPALAHAGEGREIDPSPALFGAIQVPGDGKPIVLGPDGPVTGGYPTIATVVRADLWMLARARPGDTLRFAACEPEAARRLLAERLRAFEDGTHA